jgi:integrase/recombinase XerD
MKINNPILRTYHKTLDSSYGVYFVIRLKESRIWLPVGIKIKEENWNDKKHRIVGLKNADELNLLIENSRKKIDEILIRYKLMNRDLSGEVLKREYLNPGVSYNFILYSYDYIKQKKGLSAKATISAMTSAINKLERYKREISIRDIDDRFINEYKKHLKLIGNNANTITKSLVCIKSILNQAVRDKIIEINPFSLIKLTRSIPDRVYLTRLELQKICMYYNTNMYKQEYMNICNYFLFSCFTGLRLSDIKRIRLDDIQNETLILRPLKTQNTTNEVVSIPLSNFAMSIIDKMCQKYGRPIFSNMYADQTINKYLKRMMLDTGIRKAVSFHSARHTFASLFLELNPGDVATLQKLMGHSSIEHTMVYVHVTHSVKKERINKFNELF